MPENSCTLLPATVVGIAVALPAKFSAQQKLAVAAQPEEENSNGSTSVRSVPSPKAVAGSFLQRFSIHNTSKRASQPSFITSLVESDTPFVQYVRLFLERVHDRVHTDGQLCKRQRWWRVQGESLRVRLPASGVHPAQ